MAGGGAKIAGAVLFALGAIIILASAAVIGAAVADQADNEQSGPLGTGEDGERTDRNMAGAAGAVGGLILGAVLSIAGVVAIAIGIGQRTSQLRDGLRQAQQQTVVVTGGAGADAVLQQQDDGMAPGGVPRPAIIGLAALGLIVLAFVGVTAMGIGPVADGLGIEGPGDDEPWLGAHTDSASVPAMATLLGNSQSTASAATAIEAPVGTVRIQANFNWTPADGGLEEIRFIIEYLDGDTWRELGSATGGPGITLTVSDDQIPSGALADHDLRYRAVAGSDGITQGQDYEVRFDFYATL